MVVAMASRRIRDMGFLKWNAARACPDCILAGQLAAVKAKSSLQAQMRLVKGIGEAQRLLVAMFGDDLIVFRRAVVTGARWSRLMIG